MGAVFGPSACPLPLFGVWSLNRDRGTGVARRENSGSQKALAAMTGRQVVFKR